MKFSVYHFNIETSYEAKGNFCSPSVQRTKQLWIKQQAYIKVAEINFDDTNNTDETWDLERCFELTNHTDIIWTSNSDIKLFNGKIHRSTMYGDVIVKHFENHDEIWLCNLIGWSKV